MSNLVSILDADASVMMGKTVKNGTSLLSEVLSLFQDAYIHEFVYNEVLQPSKHFQQMVSSEYIQKVDDTILLDLLVDGIGNETLGCIQFIDILKDSLNALPQNHPLHTIYSPILIPYRDMQTFLTDLKNVELQIPIQKVKDTGEIKTLLTTQVFGFLGVESVNFYFSNDARARKTLVKEDKFHNIRACSPIGSFILLKEAGNSKEYCNKYFKRLGDNNIKALDSNGNEILTSHQQLFDDIFNPVVNVGLSLEGLIKYL
jgi:hypothetical protein